MKNQLEYLYSLQRRGVKLGLEHTNALLKHLDNPHKDLTLIHIAGTNGKGSTASHIYSILREYGYSVGLYTSPHLVSFNERIRINGIPISNQRISKFIKNIHPIIEKIESTFFEVTTAMALSYFKEKNIDVGVIETGLGGRLDSTNVIQPALTIITPISMDHTDILGDSLEEIAYEKAGIIKNKISVISALQEKTVLKILEKKVCEKNTSMFLSNKPNKIIIKQTGTSFKIDNYMFHTPLIGKHQAENANLAINAIKHFDPRIDFKIIQRGLNNVKWPGRLQLLSKNLYYDVSHNEEGIRATLYSLRIIFPKSKIYGLFCLKDNKKINRIANQLKYKFERLFVTTSQNGLLLDAEKLSVNLKDLGIKNYLEPSIKVGIKKIKRNIKNNNIGLIFGSHYIADEVFSEFELSFDSGII